jgi:plastocyanin
MFPPRRRACALVWVLSVVKPGLSLAATIVVAVQMANGQPLSGAVVIVHGVSAGERPGVPVQAVMDQVDRTFEPDLLVVPVGSSVEFPNSDSVSHQIYSFSAAKRFQLPLYRGKPYPPVRFDQAGIVTLGCNIHDSMLAYVIVTDAPYFGRTDPAGTWSVEVPHGTYRVTVWHPRMREDAELERQMMIGDKDRAALTLRLDKALQPASLESSRHSWDSY